MTLATFTWWVCTASSDQMAIQRYLATRDVRTARQVLATTLGANTLVNLILAAVGLALLALFVPWAKSWATIVGAASGVAVVVSINFWKEFAGSEAEISFLWAMPLGLAVQIGVGAVASLIPVGQPGSRE